ncbi:MAG: hypothetical protein ACPG7F_18130, partial [Aggregatilineales bacterium]
LIGIDKFSNRQVIVKDGFLKGIPMLNKAIEFIANDLSVVDARDLFVERAEHKDYHTYELTGIDLPNNDFRTRYEFPIGETTEKLILERIYRRERQYDNHPIVQIHIPNEHLIEGWETDEIADMWCALISLAIGRDVQWLRVGYSEEKTLILKWIRRGTVFGTGSFTGLISSNSIGFDTLPIIKFVEICFDSIRSKLIVSDAAIEYVRAIRHYVTYSLTSLDTDDKARLFAINVEKLLLSWEDTNFVSSLLVSKNEIEKIEKIDFQSILIDLKIEATTAEEVTQKINSLIGSALHRRLTSRMKTYFIEEFSNAWYKKNVAKRLQSFEKTRNSVAHGGKIPGEAYEEESGYYYNLKMILPLMVFALFNYEGNYVDLIEHYGSVIQSPY